MAEVYGTRSEEVVPDSQFPRLVLKMHEILNNRDLLPESLKEEATVQELFARFDEVKGDVTDATEAEKDSVKNLATIVERNRLLGGMPWDYYSPLSPTYFKIKTEEDGIKEINVWSID